MHLKGSSTALITLKAAILLILGAVNCFGAAPVITTQPSNQIIFEGTAATFTVGASGTAPLRYQWQRNSAPISGATNTSYTLPSVSSADNESLFSVVVSNASGKITSAEARLRVDPGIVLAQSARLITISNFWSYNQSNVNLGTAWIAPGYADSGWPQGRGVFEARTPPRATLSNGEAVRTQLVLTNAAGSNKTTFYFRTHFTNTITNTFSVILQPTFCVDDGAAAYLNGTELHRVGLEPGATFGTYANRSVDDNIFEGPFSVTNVSLPAGDNVVAAELHQTSGASIDATFGFILDATYFTRFRDTNPVVVSGLIPAASSVVPSLRYMEVAFSKQVEGVGAADLRVNGTPATNLVQITPQQFRWEFPTITNGVVNFTWAAGHGIYGVDANSNSFTPTNWSITVNATSTIPRVVISEFMASNKETLKDEDGDFSDWVELYNDETTAVNLNGWGLSDNASNLAKWRIPAVTIPGKGFLIIFASSKNRTNVLGKLHSNFSLDKDGEFLGLSTPWGALASAFAPTFPPQQDDVSYGRDRLDPNITGFYTEPTPETTNSAGGSGFGPAVVFSRAGCTFSNSFQLTLSAPGGSNAVIRYLIVTNAFTTSTTNIPTTNSTLYTGPITVNRSMQVRARTFVTAGTSFPGPPHSEGYIQLGANTATFDSDLPVAVIHTLGPATIPSGDPNPDQVVLFSLFEPRFGVARLSDTPALMQRAAINVRGKSTAAFAKSSFSVEFQDEYGDDEKHEILDMESESDWVLYAANLFDLAKIANPLAYRISRESGAYAPRTRFVELLMNNEGTALGLPTGFSSANYRGIYVLEERIKRGSERVDIDKLEAEQTNAPAITGGYLFKVDLPDPDERSFTWATLGTTWNSYSHQEFIYQDPPGIEMISAARRPQAQYLSNYLNSFTAALNAPDWTNRVSGWAPYVNWSSAVDYHLINTVLFNCDALRWSTYFYKPRNGPLAFGPVWDFDRAMGANRTNSPTAFEHRPFNPRQFIASEALTGNNGGTDMFNPDYKFGNMWYGRMFRDIDFFQMWIDRYQELRGSVLSTNTLFGFIDGYANQVRQAQPREAQRWNSGDSDTRPRSGTLVVDGYTNTFPGTYQGEVDFLKKWFTDRLRFMDTNFLAKPAMSLPTGPITNGAQVTLTDLSGKAGTTLYYTLNGTDPRAPYGGIAAGAVAYTGPITLASNALLTVRARNTSHSNLTGLPGKMPLNSIWSGPMKASYYSTTPPLRITEIMYHPANPPAGNTNDSESFEYIEFKNISANPLPLGGFRLVNGVEFTFPNLTLPAGGACVAVSDLALFQSRYGPSPLVVGQYTNQLDNSGERVTLVGPLGEPILDFTYDDNWYPATDGLGFSLVLVNPNAATSTWGLKSSWRPSGTLNGSPGVNDSPGPVIGPVFINEALIHTDPPLYDTVELYNPNTNSVDISGWFLSDDFKQQKKYQFPPGTVLGPRSYVTFSETNTFGVGTDSFLISALGDELWLFSADASSNLTGYAHGFAFGAQQNGVTFGRHVDSTGREHFVTQWANSLGATNVGPLVRPIVISEFSYHPVDIALGFQTYDNVRDEFIQLSNLSDDPVPLFYPAAPTNTWRLTGAVDYSFPTNLTLAPRKNMIVVGFNPATETSALAAFRLAYPASTNATVVGPWSGVLSNDKETIELMRPDEPNLDGFVPYILVEQIDYLTEAPWPTNADGTGLSLHRAPANSFGDDAASWVAAAPTPGIVISNANFMPTGFDQTLTNGEEMALSISLTGADMDGPAMNFVVVTNPIHGSLSGTPPNLIYTPEANYFGPDQLKFRVNDGALTSAVATVNIVLTNVNDAPVAFSQNLTNAEDTALSISLTGADLDGPVLNFVVVTNPIHGSLTGTPPNLTYLPATNYFGPDSLAFQVNDGSLTSAVATVSITVVHVNAAPQPATDFLTRSSSQGVTAPITLLLTNDSDPDGDLLNLLSVSNASPAGATISLSSNLVTYWPLFGDTNAGSFTYVISDGNASATGVVNIAVQPDPQTSDVLQIASTNGASVRVTLNGVPGFTYTVQRATTINPPDWQKLTVSPTDGLGQISLMDAITGSTNRWYRTVRGRMP